MPRRRRKQAGGFEKNERLDVHGMDRDRSDEFRIGQHCRNGNDCANDSPASGEAPASAHGRPSCEDAEAQTTAGSSREIRMKGFRAIGGSFGVKFHPAPIPVEGRPRLAMSARGTAAGRRSSARWSPRDPTRPSEPETPWGPQDPPWPENDRNLPYAECTKSRTRAHLNPHAPHVRCAHSLRSRTKTRTASICTVFARFIHMKAARVPFGSSPHIVNWAYGASYMRRGRSKAYRVRSHV